ncbi:hypothetical protein AX15_002846 [Amanita polypyramis BW_CC]|nr:hypothetical protein AX15_002846 [Amanita polypyramis BW_CC]
MHTITPSTSISTFSTDAGRQSPISILTSPSSYYPNTYRSKGLLHWAVDGPSSGYEEHKRIKRISPAERRKADGLVNNPSSKSAARAERQVKKLRKAHHEACITQVKRENEETRRLNMGSGWKSARDTEEIVWIPRQRVEEIFETLWQELVVSKLRRK